MRTHVKRARRERALARSTCVGVVALSLIVGVVNASPANAAAKAITSDSILAPLALDGRMADNGTTPIAVRSGVGSSGAAVVYGARAYKDATVSDLAGAVAGTRYFVDCGSGGPGVGTIESPFTTLAEANAVVLGPGDELLLRRGSVCTGMLNPQGSGSSDHPVVIDAYGDTSAAMPRIDGAGANQAVLLENVQHYTVRNLELTNKTGDARDYAQGSVRRGIAVQLSDFGTGAGYTLTGLYIHDIAGEGKKDLGGSSGIQFEVRGMSVPSKFSDVEISYNTLRNVNRSGINMSTSWWERGEVKAGPPDTYYGWDPMHIHDNFLTDIGGDGIVVQYASGSLVENNTVERSGNVEGKTSNNANAAVWAWNADRVAFRFNHVFDTQRAPDNNDGMAFDVDFGTTGTLFEQNLSHDNVGGFLLFCGCYGVSSEATVRYNVSLNDGRTVPVVRGSGIARTFFLGGQMEGLAHNNTILLPPTEVDIAYDDDWLADNVLFANNVFIAQPGSVVRESATGGQYATINWRQNVFAGTASGWPEQDGGAVLAREGVSSGTGLGRLVAAAAATLGKGIPVAPAGTRDMRGALVPSATRPDIGAFQIMPVRAADDIALPDGGFESRRSAWELSGSATISRDGVRSGQRALVMGKRDGDASSDVLVAANRAYRLVAAVSAANVADASVTVRLASGVEVTAKPIPGATADAQGYIAVQAVFRTAADADRVVVEVHGTNRARVDDVSLLPIEDLMVDGSFEALRNTVWQQDNGDFWQPFPRTEDAVSGDYASPVTGAAPARARFIYVQPGTAYDLTVFARAAGAPVKLSWSNAAGQGGSQETTASEYVQIGVPLTSSTTKVDVSCAGEGSCDDMLITPVFDGLVPRVGV